MDIEDELHFILICSTYNVLRKNYVKKYFYAKLNVLKFIELMRNENFGILYRLYKFVYEAFVIKQNTINYRC